MWEKTEEWRKYGNSFLVTVYHFNMTQRSAPELKNYWNVYVYIYPEHPLFKEIEGIKINSSWQCPFSEYFHGGCSFFRRHYNDRGEITSFQFGSDYNHLGDDMFSYYKSEDDAREVFLDAEKLFNYMNEKNV